MYQPTITLRIPADIPAAKHDAIKAEIAAANDRLAAYSVQTAQQAREIAATALFRSSAGACGYADAKPLIPKEGDIL